MDSTASAPAAGGVGVPPLTGEARALAQALLQIYLFTSLSFFTPTVAVLPDQLTGSYAFIASPPQNVL